MVAQVRRDDWADQKQFDAMMRLVNELEARVAAFEIPTETAANIAAANAAVNCLNNFAGRIFRYITNNILIMVRGSLPTSQWDVVDGSASVTPA